MKFNADALAKLPKSRKAAKEAGSPYYFTGEPCIHGHLAARYLCNTGCLDCVNYTLKRVAMPGVAQLTFPVVGSQATRSGLAQCPELLDRIRTILLNDMALIDWLFARARRNENGVTPTTIRFEAGPLPLSATDIWPTEKLRAQGVDLAQMLQQGWTPAQLVEHGWASVATD